MTTTGRTTAATVTSGLILLLGSLLLLVEIGETGSSRGRGRRRAHAQARKSGLVAPVRVLWWLRLRLLLGLLLRLLLLLLLRGIYWYTKLLLSQLRELEGVELRGYAAHGGVSLDGRSETANLAQLLWLQEPHVNILLMCSCDLLLLLLKQFNLLLYCQLLHYFSPNSSLASKH